MSTNNSSDNEIMAEVNSALALDIESPSSDTASADSQGLSKKLGQLLRSVGALVVIAAAVSFLIQRWGGFDHLSRYFSFLGFTASLGLFGLFCALKLKEDKSARTFLALGGALVVVNFAQLGALIYSKFLNPLEFVKYPDFLLWQAPSTTAILITMGVGLPILSLVMAASFSALAREIRKPLFITAMTLNCALLIPLRDPTINGLLSLAVVMLLAHTYKTINALPICKTFEGRIALTHLLIPVMMLIGRGTYLYEASNMFVCCLALSASVILFEVLPKLFETNASKITLQRLSIVTNAIASYTFTSALYDSFNIFNELAIPLMLIPFIASLVLMSTFGLSNGRFEIKLAAISGLLGLILQVWLFPGIITFTFALFLSIIIMSYGLISKEQHFFYCGLGGVAISLISHIEYAYRIASHNPWLSLAIIGSATIVGAAYAERNLAKVLARFKQNKS